MTVTPRKLPRQARAKATVDAIVEATTQLLVAYGYDRVTTSRVAERAGVSIGSLYQYFPNKAALASAVVDRCCDEFLTAFNNVVAGRRRATLADCIHAIVDAGFISHHLTPELHRIVIDLAPRIGVAAKAASASRSAARAIETELRKHAGEIAPDVDIAIAATVIETALEALAHRAVVRHPAHVEDDLLAREAVRLVHGYLTRQVG